MKKKLLLAAVVLSAIVPLLSLTSATASARVEEENSFRVKPFRIDRIRIEPIGGGSPGGQATSEDNGTSVNDVRSTTPRRPVGGTIVVTTTGPDRSYDRNPSKNKFPEVKNGKFPGTSGPGPTNGPGPISGPRLTVSVPEPGAVILLALSFAGLLVFERRRSLVGLLARKA